MVDLINSTEYNYKWKLKVSQIDCDCPGFWIGLSDYQNLKVPFADNHDRSHLNDNCWRACNGKYYFITNMGTAQTKEMEEISWGNECIIDMSLEYVGHAIECPHCKDGYCVCNYFEGWYELKFYVDGHLFHECEISSYLKTPLNVTVVIAEKGQKIEILKFDKTLIFD